MPLFLRHPKTLMYLSNVATKPSMGLPCLPIGIDPHWAKFRHRLLGCLLFGDLKIWMTFQGSATILKEGQKAHESRKRRWSSGNTAIQAGPGIPPEPSLIMAVCIRPARDWAHSTPSQNNNGDLLTDKGCCETETFSLVV